MGHKRKGNKMRYTIHKCCKLKATNPKQALKLIRQSLQSYRIFDLECPDYCGNEKEASISFKYAFKRHIGEYPTKEQRDSFLKFENVFVQKGDITYIFYMTISV